MLKDILKTQGVSGCAALAGSVCPVRMPRLLEEFSPVSVLVMTVPYRSGEETMPLAAFAAARDYHAYFADLFRKAAAYLGEKYPGARLAGFADHSPYDEVHLAAMAGLGVRGDNGLLLTPEYGSFVVIGELLTDLSPAIWKVEGIPYLGDGVAVAECEHCGLCAVACPGGCLPGTSRETCASAISQKKAALTAEEESILRRSGYVWGCDCCQTACPHNRDLPTAPGAYFREDVLRGIDQETLSGLSDEAYKARAFGWRPRRVLQRNLELEGITDD